jgi:hypothetical protein
VSRIQRAFCYHSMQPEQNDAAASAVQWKLCSTLAITVVVLIYFTSSILSRVMHFDIIQDILSCGWKCSKFPKIKPIDLPNLRYVNRVINIKITDKRPLALIILYGISKTRLTVERCIQMKRLTLASRLKKVI